MKFLGAVLGTATLLCVSASALDAPAAPWAPDTAVIPKLNYQRSNDHVTLSWKISPFDFVLSAQTNLPATNQVSWPPEQQTFLDDEARVTLQMTNTQQFFKLNKTAWPGSAALPLFQFGVFYGMNMEISTGQPMTITGPVHANGITYIEPDNELVFQHHVTATGPIHFSRDPIDGRPAPVGTVQYLGGRASNAVPLVMPIGTNSMREILNPPPIGEPADSPMGRHRYFNLADVIITLTATDVTSTTGVPFGKAAIPSQHVIQFATNSGSFWDAREEKTVLPVNIDVGAFRRWAITNTFRFGGRFASSIYVLDQRVTPSNQLAAVRVRNGMVLPPAGLTIATARPLYILGNYNQTNLANLGTTNTSTTLPALLAADAITILSGNWSDAFSTAPVGERVASPVTVNAALLGGIVETITNNYSGGRENFPRFLEVWGTNTFTYNGSFAVLFPSQYAVGRWGRANVYAPPKRNWNLDRNFLDPARLPPFTPMVGILANPQ